MSTLDQKLFDIAKRMTLMTLIFAPTGVVVGLCLLEPAIVTGLASRLASVEIGDFKVVLGQEAFTLNGDLGANKNLVDQMTLIDRARRLGPREVERLMHFVPLGRERIADHNLSCDYQRADSKTRLYTVIDDSLAEKGLIALQERDDLTPERTHEAFGPASRCYQAILTAEGADVKSLIVSEMTRFFGRELDVSGPKGEAVAKGEAGR